MLLEIQSSEKASNFYSDFSNVFKIRNKKIEMIRHFSDSSSTK